MRKEINHLVDLVEILQTKLIENKVPCNNSYELSPNITVYSTHANSYVSVSLYNVYPESVRITRHNNYVHEFTSEITISASITDDKLTEIILRTRNEIRGYIENIEEMIKQHERELILDLETRLKQMKELRKLRKDVSAS